MKQRWQVGCWLHECVLRNTLAGSKTWFLRPGILLQCESAIVNTIGLFGRSLLQNCPITVGLSNSLRQSLQISFAKMWVVNSNGIFIDIHYYREHSTRGTARSRKDQTRNRNRSWNRSPEWSSHVSFQTAHLKRNVIVDHPRFQFEFRWPFRVSFSKFSGTGCNMRHGPGRHIYIYIYLYICIYIYIYMYIMICSCDLVQGSLVGPRWLDWVFRGKTKRRQTDMTWYWRHGVHHMWGVSHLFFDDDGTWSGANSWALDY